MNISYKNKKLEKICTNAEEAQKKYGNIMADLIHQRIDEISAAPTVEMMIQFHIGRCHRLSGKRKRQYAVDLEHPYRMVFEKREDSIQIAHIIEIIDYH